MLEASHVKLYQELYSDVWLLWAEYVFVCERAGVMVWRVRLLRTTGGHPHILLVRATVDVENTTIPSPAEEHDVARQVSALCEGNHAYGTRTTLAVVRDLIPSR